MHKSQIFFYLLSSFILGVFFGSLFNFTVTIVLTLVIIGVSVIILSGFKNKYIILAGFLILVFAGGIARFSAIGGSQPGADQPLAGAKNSGGNLKSNLTDYIGQEVSLVGYVDSEPEIDGTNQRLVFNTEGNPRTQGAEQQPRESASGAVVARPSSYDGNRILITVGPYPRYKFGDTIEVRGELGLPQNFDDFDYVTYLKKDGIWTILFFPKISEYNGEIELSFLGNLRISLYKYIFVLKDRFQRAVNVSVAEPNASFINGILLGSRQNIPDDLKDAFKKTGTTHILAISGYNIMIISEAVLLGLIFFVRRRVAFWLSVAVIFLFVVMTGASASVVRAAAMGLLLSFARGYGRLYDQKNSIIFAGAIMIWVNPFVLVFDIGFQLSFAAVLGLIYLYPWLDRKFNKLVPTLSSTKSEPQNQGLSISQSSQDDLREIGNGMKELILMTISAQVAVAPLLIYYFGGFSPISLPANILILPFIPIAMFLGFIAGLIGMISIPLSQIMGYFAWAITTYQIEIIELLASI